MSADPWRVIEDRETRTWEVYDQHGRWIARLEARDSDEASRDVRSWLCDDAACQRLVAYEARVQLVCRATDERVRYALAVSAEGRDASFF